MQTEAIVVVPFGAGEHPQDFAYDALCGTCRVKAAQLNGMPALRADIWQGLAWAEFVRPRSVAIRATPGTRSPTWRLFGKW